MSFERVINRKKLLIFLFAAMAILAVFSYYLWSRYRVSTDDAFVDGRVYTITPRVTGYVTKMLVEDNQLVRQGQPLLTLDPTDYEVSLADAKATLASLALGVPLQRDQTVYQVSGAKAQLESRTKDLEKALKDEEAALQNVRRAKSESDMAGLDLGRNQKLLTDKVVAQSALDQAETKAKSTRADLRAAEALLDGARKQKASVEADLERLRASVSLAATGDDLAVIKARQVEAQQAKVKQAELDLSYTTIVSPSDGYVTSKKIEAGVMVSKGQPLMAVVPLSKDAVWITANYKETQLTRVRPGQAVVIEVDAYPGVTLKGKVESIMAGTGSTFSLFPPENASGNYVKVVQRVPVKIVLTDHDASREPRLRVGMSVIPTILTGDGGQ